MAGKNKRAVENRRIRQEALREELKAREYLRQIGIILERDHTDSQAIQQSKMKLDGYFKLLNKVLPDARDIQEVQFEDVTKSKTELTDDELAVIAAGSSTGITDKAKGPQKPH